MKADNLNPLPSGVTDHELLLLLVQRVDTSHKIEVAQNDDILAKVSEVQGNFQARLEKMEARIDGINVSKLAEVVGEHEKYLKNEQYTTTEIGKILAFVATVVTICLAALQVIHSYIR